MILKITQSYLEYQNENYGDVLSTYVFRHHFQVISLDITETNNWFGLLYNL